MRHDLQCQLVERVLAHLEHKTTDCEDRPTLQPVATYMDEARTLFRELPVIVGHASQVAAPGDFITHDASGVPLLIVRGDDGALGAFLNVCRHRGTRVEPAACGAKKAFVCPYHAWSYRRDGALLGIPHEHGFGSIDRSSATLRVAARSGEAGPFDRSLRGLVRVPCAELAGFIFVRPQPSDAALDAAAWLGPIADDLVGFGIANAHVYAPIVKHKAMAWQLAIDVFLESYHLRPTHGDSIYPLFFDNVGLVDPIGPHLRNVFPKRTIRELPTQPRERWELRRHANVLYHLFPNTLILVEPDHAAVLHLWPQGPAHTLLTAYTLVPEPPVTDKARAYWDANNAILYNAIDEDFAMGESIQRGLASGANSAVVFGAFEHALAHFHRQIAKHAGEITTPA